MGRNNQKSKSAKRSGVVYSKIKNGNFKGGTIINAWRVTRNGLVTFKVSPYKGTKQYMVDNDEMQTMMCEVVNKTTGQSTAYPVSYNLNTKKIYLKKIGICITPNGSGKTKSGKYVTGSVVTYEPRK